MSFKQRLTSKIFTETDTKCEIIPEIEYPEPLGLYGRYCFRCAHYVSTKDTECDLCEGEVTDVIKIREFGELLAGSRAYKGEIA